LTQMQLAIKLDVCIASVNRWETGKSTPLPAVRKRLAELDKAKEASTGG